MFCFRLVTATSKHLFLVVSFIYRLYLSITLRMYVSCLTMSSSLNLVLTSSSQLSTLGVGLVLSEEVRINKLAIEERRRVKQICDKD